MSAAASRDERPTPGELRWNFCCAVIDAGGWGLGMGFVSVATILPLFVEQLTPARFATGLIPAVQLFGWLVPGILVSGWLERLPRVKTSVMWIAALERVALFLVAPLTLWLGPHDRGALLLGFFACWFVMNAAMGANMPGYFKLIAKTIPPELRGRLYGISGAVSGLLGIVAAAAAGWLLKHWGFPRGYAACFLAATVVQTITVIPLGLIREPVQPPAEAPEARPGWHSLRLIREDRRLFWLGIVLALFSLNQMAGAFYTVFAIDRFRATPEDVAWFNGVVSAVRTVAFLLAGWLGDRWGNRLALRVAIAAGMVASGLALAAPDLSWIYAVFAFNEIAVQGWSVCSMNYVLELCRPERSGTYTAVFNALSGPFRVLLPLAGGAVVGQIGYPPLFTAATVGAILTLLLLLTRLPEPRREQASLRG